MTKIKMFVGLKIPDTTCITAFRTLKKVGIKIEDLQREDYFEFEWLKDPQDFINRIQEVDILVNANKNYSKCYEYDQVPKDEFIWIVVKEIEKDSSLLSTLQERMGFHDIADMHKGTLWKFKASKEDAEKAVKELLYNSHYQGYEFL